MKIPAERSYLLPRITALLILLLVGGCYTVDTAENSTLHEVFYMTVREATSDNRPSRQFNGQRGKPSVGMALVAIDSEAAYTSFAEQQENRILSYPDPLLRGPIQKAVPFDDTRFNQSLRKYLDKPTSKKEILIYIHGYRKDFSRSLFNAAQLRHQLAFSGPVIAFSWPSNNSWARYLSDIDNAEWSEPQLRQFITRLAELFPDSRIHILAHSLGNRPLIKSLLYFIRNKETLEHWPFGEIVFLAPDFDRELFLEETAPNLAAAPSRLTLYVSARDFPLMASAQVFQYERLGDSRKGPPIVEGIQTIDVSDSISITSGHGYYEESRDAIEDLYYLIHEGKGADQRPNLKEIQTKEGRYWRLQPTSQ